MKIIPFDIKLRDQIQSEENNYKGRYEVQTKDGRSVRIVCWDVKDSKFPIVAIVDDLNKAPFSFCKNGKYNYSGSECDNDLCLVDTFEPKFKVGDKVKYKCGTSIYTITAVGNTGYILSNGGFTLFKNENEFELVSIEKPTEFEKELANCLYKSIGINCMAGMETLAIAFAPKLLELAKKEIIEKLKEE